MPVVPMKGLVTSALCHGPTSDQCTYINVKLLASIFRHSAEDLAMAACKQLAKDKDVNSCVMANVYAPAHQAWTLCLRIQVSVLQSPCQRYCHQIKKPYHKFMQSSLAYTLYMARPATILLCSSCPWQMAWKLQVAVLAAESGVRAESAVAVSTEKSSRTPASWRAGLPASCDRSSVEGTA